MANQTTLHRIDTNNIRLEQQVHRYTQNIESIQNHVARLIDHVENTQNREAQLNAKLQTMENADLSVLPDEVQKAFDLPSILKTIQASIVHAAQHRRSYERDLAERRRQLLVYESHLAEVQQALAQAKFKAKNSAVSIDKTLLRKGLKSLSNVSRVIINESTAYFSITVCLENLTMSYLSQHEKAARYAQEWLNRTLKIKDRVELSKVPVPDCKIKIRYSKARGIFTISGTPTNRDPEKITYPGIMGRFHPHWIGQNAPCYGDFGGPIMEALDDFDFETAFTLLHMFLSQYNLDDVAGKHGLAWGLNASSEIPFVRRIILEYKELLQLERDRPLPIAPYPWPTMEEQAETTAEQAAVRKAAIRATQTAAIAVRGSEAIGYIDNTI